MVSCDETPTRRTATRPTCRTATETETKSEARTLFQKVQRTPPVLKLVTNHDQSNHGERPMSGVIGHASHASRLRALRALSSKQQGVRVHMSSPPLPLPRESHVRPNTYTRYAPLRKKMQLRASGVNKLIEARVAPLCPVPNTPSAEQTGDHAVLLCGTLGYQILDAEHSTSGARCWFTKPAVAFMSTSPCRLDKNRYTISIRLIVTF